MPGVCTERGEVAMKRNDGGYSFHGGCIACTQRLNVCAGCCYMEPNWDLPNMNDMHIKERQERSLMKMLAYAFAKKYRRGG